MNRELLVMNRPSTEYLDMFLAGIDPRFPWGECFLITEYRSQIYPLVRKYMEVKAAIDPGL